MSPPPLPLRRTLNNPRQIQHLDLRAPILEHAGDSRKRREGIRRNLALRLCHFREKCRFADAGEPDERDACVAALADVEAGTAAGAGAGRGLEELGAQTGEFAA